LTLEQKLPMALSSLPWKRQLAFSLLVLERLLPSPIAFSKDTHLDVSSYLAARDYVWTALGGIPDLSRGRSLNDACLRDAPDTEKFSHDLTSFALDAALAVSDILEFIADGRLDHTLSVSTHATDSVYLFVSGPGSSSSLPPGRAVEIEKHPLVQGELRRQEEDFKFLSGLPDAFNSETISLLRARASAQPPLLTLLR